MFVAHANDLEEGHRQNIEAKTSVGELYLKGENGKASNALLLNTHIDAQVNGLIATVKIKQTFKNESDSWVNGRYVFPLPEQSSVDGLILKIGDREIHGVIKEKSEAKRQFEQAKRAGKKASLLEQHRPNMFSISVSNIPPQGEVVTEISIIDRVSYENREFSFRLPTTITPRYIIGEPIELDIEENKEIHISNSSGWANNTDVVSDASEITPPQFYQNNVVKSKKSHHFTLSLRLNSGIDLSKVYSDTHQLLVTNDDKNSFDLSLQNGQERMDHDLVIQWLPKESSAPTAALFQQKIEGEYYSMAMLIPPTTNVKVPLARETTFIIDSSGSMAGSSMEQAKNSILIALDKLNPNDFFNVIDFDSNFTPLFNQPRQASTVNVQRAKAMVHSLQADGGTEMFKPLDYALSAPVAENFIKQVIFITDGSIGNEKQLFELIHRKLGDARLFTVGIGSAPNSYFMNKAAQFGRGSFTYIASIDQSVKKMTELFNKINSPVARDLKVSYPGISDQVEQYPRDIPDLYSGEPLVVYVKSSSQIKKAVIEGNLLGNKWSHTLVSNNKSESDKGVDNIDALWARKKISGLMDNLFTGFQTQKQVKPKVIELGLKHHLVTKFTSFVAIDKVQSKPIEQNAKNKNVANLMPRGSKMVAPQTATPATLLALLGSLLMFIAGVIRYSTHWKARLWVVLINLKHQG